MSSGSRPPLRVVPPPARLADVTVARSDDLLDPGAGALRLFDRHLPRWRRLPADLRGTPVGPDTDPDHLRARYDAQRGVDFAALAARVGALREASAAVRGQHVATVEDLGPLWDTWTGPDAEAVQARVSSLARSAHALVTALDGAADALETAGTDVAAAVAEQARHAVALPPDGPVGGLAVADVDRLLDTLLDPPGAPRHAADEQRCQAWARDLEERCRAFLAVCAGARAACEGAWARADEQMAGLAAPGGAVSTSGPRCP